MKIFDHQTPIRGIGVGEKILKRGALLMRRLRSTQLSTIAFYLFGLILLVAFDLPSTLHIIRYNFLLWFLIIPVTLTIIASTLLLAQQISADGGSDMVRRPWWFCFVMLSATVFAYAVIWQYHQFLMMKFHGGIFVVIQYRYALFLAPLSWLSCLYLQRAEDEAKFASLSIRRSILSREVAQSQLLAARSQINPLLVVRTLSEIQVFYETEADRASALMDHLISYLRLAMNRLRENPPSIATEIALIRSYFSLREAENAKKIALEMHFPDPNAPQRMASSAPLFLISQRMFEAAVAEGDTGLAMRIDVLDGAIVISLGVGKTAMSNEGLACLEKDLNAIFGSSRDILHHLSQDEHWYVIELPLQGEVANGIDR